MAFSWLQFNLLSQVANVRHATFLRGGGFSPSPWNSLNVSDRQGDQKELVDANRKLIANFFSVDTLVTSHQEHKSNAVYIDHPSQEAGYADILLTDKKQIALTILHADCQAAILFDLKNNGLALVHAGWRGNVADIYATAIDCMKDRWRTDPKDLIACVSPSLGPCHSEFINWREELPPSFWPFQISPNYFDLWEITFSQLKKCGVKEEHIEIARKCTYCDEKDFFSFRRAKITGRNATVAMLL